jgi:hypothetical protein
MTARSTSSPRLRRVSFPNPFPSSAWLPNSASRSRFENSEHAGSRPAAPPARPGRPSAAVVPACLVTGLEAARIVAMSCWDLSPCQHRVAIVGQQRHTLQRDVAGRIRRCVESGPPRANQVLVTRVATLPQSPREICSNRICRFSVATPVWMNQRRKWSGSPGRRRNSPLAQRRSEEAAWILPSQPGALLRSRRARRIRAR